MSMGDGGCDCFLCKKENRIDYEWIIKFRYAIIAVMCAQIDLLDWSATADGVVTSIILVWLVFRMIPVARLFV